MVGKLLICSGRHNFVDARAISVVNQIKDGDNPVSLILAETLLGLDVVFHGGETQIFLGGPLTLQISTSSLILRVHSSLILLNFCLTGFMV